MVNQSQGKIRSHGIYLLPNLLTLAGFFAAFYAVVAAMHGRYEQAAIAILVAMVMDGLDGSVARMIHASSEFGKQLDSLADIVSFGLAPAMVLYSWSLQHAGKIGWLTAFLYAACSALRLARFNAQPAMRHFQGLSTTMAAAFIATGVWALSSFPNWGAQHTFWIMGATVLLSLLKVSSIRYESLKGLDLSGKVPFMAIFALVLVLVLVALDPQHVLFGMVTLYVLSGPVMAVVRLVGYRRKKKAKVDLRVVKLKKS